MRCTFVLLLCILQVASSYKIAFFLPFAGPSQLNIFAPIANELAARSHEVTIISSARSPSKFATGVTFHRTQSDSVSVDFMNKHIQAALRSTPLEQVASSREMIGRACRNFLTDSVVKDLLSKGMHLDLVYVDSLYSECAVAIAPLIAKHTAYLETCTVMSWKSSAVPTPPSIVPNFYDPYPAKMSFWQRFQNALTILTLRLYYEHRIMPLMQEITTELVPQAPSLVEAEKGVSFTLLNSDPVMYSARPSMPNLAFIGGIHCREPQPLPKDLEDYVQSSGNEGFIMFGLGSNARSSFLEDATILAFLSAFSKLKQKVIWKFEENIKHKLPQNVKLVKWLPQQDLLGHPKVRLFITHGGLLSLQEAVYHGVPVIATPLFADQPGNAARVVDLEIGERFNPLSITEEGVYGTINKILTNKKYAENMKKYSKIMKDQPELPLTRAVFWTEYIIRHNGADHLRSAAEDLSFAEYFLLDVIAFVSIVSLIVIYLFIKLVKIVYTKLFGKKGNYGKEKKRK